MSIVRQAAKPVPLADAAAEPERRRFGQPSSYSLSSRELAAEIRRRRRDGWQSWEIRARFDFWHAA